MKKSTKKKKKKGPRKLWRHSTSHGPYPAKERIKGRKHKTKSPRILSTIKDKHKPINTVEPDNGKAIEMA